MAEPRPSSSARPGAAAWEAQLHVLGEYIKTQRQMANLSLRRLAELAQVSNPYLSQLERGLHEPSVRVLQQVAHALRMPVDDFFDRLGKQEDVAAGEAADAHPTETVIERDDALTAEQKSALLSVYRSYVDTNVRAAHAKQSGAQHSGTTQSGEGSKPSAAPRRSGARKAPRKAV